MKLARAPPLVAVGVTCMRFLLPYTQTNIGHVTRPDLAYVSTGLARRRWRHFGATQKRPALPTKTERGPTRKGVRHESSKSDFELASVG